MNRLIAIGDIHGCYDTFEELVLREIRLEKSDRLILLGDYIDRGDKSREVIDFIVDLQDKGFDVTPLTGNHESMLLDSFEDKDMLPLWLMNNGMSTLNSFKTDDVSGLEMKYINFFLGLKFYEKCGSYLFVHAGFNDYAADPFSDFHGMIWECRPSYGNPLLRDMIIIHGHRPKTLESVKRVVESRASVLPIDTGCVYDKELGYGYLTALVVSEMKLFSIERI